MLFRAHAVTMVYDIGRASKDGRTVNDYVTWLNLTLRLPITFTVFLDPKIDASQIKLKPGDNLVQMSFDELYPNRWRDRVTAICVDGHNIKAKDDLTYRLPAYALVQFAKFDVLSRSKTYQPDATHVLWIDAGISRFFDTPPEKVFFDYDYFSHLAAASTASLFLAITPRLAIHLREKSEATYVGTCERLATGEMFMIRADQSETVAHRVYDYVEQQWLVQNLWDNEQVALGEILSREPTFATILDGKQQASFLKLLFPLKRHRIARAFDGLIEKIRAF